MKRKKKREYPIGDGVTCAGTRWRTSRSCRIPRKVCMLLLPGMSSCYPLVGQKEMKMLKGERRSGWSFYNEHGPAARARLRWKARASTADIYSIRLPLTGDCCKKEFKRSGDVKSVRPVAHVHTSPWENDPNEASWLFQKSVEYIYTSFQTSLISLYFVPNFLLNSLDTVCFFTRFQSGSCTWPFSVESFGCLLNHLTLTCESLNHKKQKTTW